MSGRTGDVVLRDGIRITLSDGRTVVADAGDPDGDVALLSHAHGDHLYDTAPSAVVSSSLTLDLAEVRRTEEPRPRLEERAWIQTHRAGHVPGSRAFTVEGDRRYLYTGDFSVRDRFDMAGFEPVDADVLIVESTYGRPEFRFPGQSAVEREIVDWLEDTADTPVILMGYALGRAQELIALAERAGRSRICITPAIDRLNHPIESARGRSFEATVYDRAVDLGASDALVIPSQVTSLGVADRIRRESDAVTAGFSEWAVDSSYRFARDLDVAFPLSDHCDFAELLEVTRRVDPDQVYTVHGFVDDLATAIQARLGIPARALKPNQSALSDF